MAVKEENKRVTITISKELDEKIDKLAGLQNISRNAVIVNLIETTIDATIKVWDVMKNPDIMKTFMSIANNMNDEQMKSNFNAMNEIFNSEDEKTKQDIEKFDSLIKSLK